MQVGQFRVEKDHLLQVRILAQLKAKRKAYSQARSCARARVRARVCARAYARVRARLRALGHVCAVLLIRHWHWGANSMASCA